jgi:hypothetical protein
VTLALAYPVRRDKEYIGAASSPWHASRPVLLNPRRKEYKDTAGLL